MSEWESIVTDRLLRLYKAQEAMTANVFPSVPLPRPRQFMLAPGIKWPRALNGRVMWGELTRGQDWIYLSRPGNGVDPILRACGHQPRRILRAIRRIEAATAWCLARAEGRRRAAEEILRQQARAVETLEAMAAMQALASEKH